MTDRCCVGQSKTKTYSVTLPNERTLSRIALERTDYFKERLRHRYKIEEMNGELKCAHDAEILYLLSPVEWSPLMIGLIDKFGINWCIFV